MAIDKSNASLTPAAVPALGGSGIGFATGAIVVNSVANTPTGGFILKHGVKKITFDPASSSITYDDGAGNTVFIGGSNPAVQLNDAAGNSNNQNADLIILTDNSGASISIQAASNQILISGPTGITAVLQPSLLILGGGTSGTLELDAPAVAGSSFQKFLAASGNIPVETSVPASAISAGVTGSIAFDATNFYVCVATNTWVRAALATF